MKGISMTIDGKNVDVEEGKSLLDAARGAGIPVPSLCFDERLKPYGSCRMCMVEIEKKGRKRLVASCCYPAEAGLVVRTDTKEIMKIRRVLTELAMSITDVGPHKALAAEYRIKKTRFYRDAAHDPCTLCGRCVRYCAEVAGKNAICFMGRGVDRRVALVPGASEQCSLCRKCFDLCETGWIIKLVDQER